MIASAAVTAAIGIVGVILLCWWDSGWLFLTLDDRRMEGHYLDLAIAALVVALLAPLSTLALRWRRWEQWWSYPLTFMLVFAVLTALGGGGIGTGLAIFSAGVGGAVWWFVARRSRVVAMRRRWVTIAGWLIIVTLMAALTGLIWNTIRKPPEAFPPINTAPMLGVADAHNLWVVRNDTLLRYDRSNWQAQDMAQSDVMVLMKDGDRVWALSARYDINPSHAETPNERPSGTLELASYRGETRETVLKQRYQPGGYPLGMLIWQGRPLIVTQSAILRLLPDGHWQVTPLSGNADLSQMGGGGVALPHNDPRHLYIGNDGGEFFGGADRIDLQTGLVEAIERRDGKDLCDGPLNRACHPILGMTQDPGRSDCVLATTTGAMSPMDGAILRLCGEKVEVAAQTPITPMTRLIMRLEETIAGWAGSRWPPDSQRVTESVYAMEQAKDGVVWAVGEDALYRADERGITRRPLPRVEEHAGMWMGQVPGMILIDRSHGSEHRLGGRATLLVRVQP
ncbi:hypothetical protein [Novosphingobium rosa]|uniref:hypothetical protein n=1 Tax=Novosphingobium rosa TaxID=76978 RepID=UPI0012EDB397|nr:hypothetical protein [Novosphingobium rosa]